jgi:vancomycin resistance protein YoaR
MKALRLLGLSGAFAVLGGAIGYLLLPERAPEAAAMPHIRILGRPVDPGRDPHATALAVARSYLHEHIRISGPVIVRERSGDTITERESTRTVDVTREMLGARVDVNLLAHLLASATDPSSALLRHHAAIAPHEPVDIPLPVHLDTSIASPLLMQLKEEVDHAPIDARYDAEQRRVIPEQPGRYVDLYGTLARIDEALTQGRSDLQVVLSTSPPRLHGSDLANMDLDEVVGWFETNYNSDESHRDRTWNLHVAARRINGYVWMPGEELDFNDIVGDRSEANGFHMATVISAGELIDGVGGGTCQIAGTLHAAAFFAGMEMIERHPHTRPSGYIKMGLDATVVYPALDLRMRNTLPFPVVIHTHLDAGLARIELLGAHRTRTVTFTRKIMHIDRFEERDVPDPNLAPGARVLTQRGIPGFRVRRYRIVRDGDQAVRERWEDAYPPTVQIWHVGIGGGSGRAPNQDDHPEYTADQYMATTQTPGESRMQEVRRPGITGSPGWMVREGLMRPLPTQVEAQMAAARQAHRERVQQSLQRAATRSAAPAPGRR